MGANQMVAAQARNVPLERKGTFLYSTYQTSLWDVNVG